MMDLRSRGHNDALAALGLVKTAAPPLTGLRKWLWQKMPTRSGVRKGLFGEPIRFIDEVVKGKALKKDGLIRQSFEAPTMGHKLMFYGPSALEIGNALTDDKGQKAQRIGESLGSATLGFGAFRPFGMVGSMLVDPLGRMAGRAVGQTADYLGKKTYQAIRPTPKPGGAPQAAPLSENPLGQKL